MKPEPHRRRAGLPALGVACVLAVVAGLPALVGGAPTAGPWVPDRGDGTYRNPVLFADYSDPDAIRVGDDYWLTASSFNQMPGLPILHSKDLVNWEIVNHALPENLPRDHYGEPRHGLGVYAPSIRHHDGKFWIFYPDPDFGIYVVTATDPRGAWSRPVLIREGKGYIDPCPFWDEGGKAYLVCAWAGSRGRRANLLTLFEMKPDGSGLIGEGTTIIDGRTLGWRVLEGPKLHKRDGWYWIFAPAGGVAEGFQAAFRARDIRGPYEGRIVLAQGGAKTNGPHQGAWVDTRDGEDWFLHFQHLPPHGRVTHLQPMAWRKDGWPVMGVDADDDGTGEPVPTHRKPAVPTQPVQVPATSDEFDAPELGKQWQWEANPSGSWYSLAAEPGRLRLRCVPLAPSASLLNAPNLLLQKFPAPAFSATTAVELRPQADGDTAGLVVFGSNYAWLGLRRMGARTQVVLAVFDAKNGEKREVTTVGCDAGADARRVTLRVAVSGAGRCRFEWSADGESFTAIGADDFAATHLGWVGAKVGVFATNAADTGAVDCGHAFFDWFRVGDYVTR